MSDKENSASTPQRSKPPTVASNEGKRKMLINLMDVYHCPTTGGNQEGENVFQIQFPPCRSVSN